MNLYINVISLQDLSVLSATEALHLHRLIALQIWATWLRRWLEKNQSHLRSKPLKQETSGMITGCQSEKICLGSPRNQHTESGRKLMRWFTPSCCLRLDSFWKLSNLNHNLHRSIFIHFYSVFTFIQLLIINFCLSATVTCCNSNVMKPEVKCFHSPLCSNHKWICNRSLQ